VASLIGTVWGEDPRSTSGPELGARTVLVGAYSLTNGVPGPKLCRPEVDLRSSPHSPVQSIHLW